MRFHTFVYTSPQWYALFFLWIKKHMLGINPKRTILDKGSREGYPSHLNLNLTHYNIWIQRLMHFDSTKIFVHNQPKLFRWCWISPCLVHKFLKSPTLNFFQLKFWEVLHFRQTIALPSLCPILNFSQDSSFINLESFPSLREGLKENIFMEFSTDGGVEVTPHPSKSLILQT